MRVRPLRPPISRSIRRSCRGSSATSGGDAGGLEIELMDANVAPPISLARPGRLRRDLVEARRHGQSAACDAGGRTRGARAGGRDLSRHARGRDRSRGALRVATDRDLAVEAPFVVNAAGAWGNEIAEIFGETTPMFPAAPPNFVTEPLPHFIHAALQAVDGSVIFRQVERGNVIVGFYPRGPADRVRQPRTGAARQGSARPRQHGTRGADAARRAGDPGVVRDRRLPARHAAGDGLEPHDEEPAACLRILRSRLPAQSRASATRSPR